MYGLFKKITLFSALIVCVLAAPAHGARIKDIATVEGVRDNQLIGYGLVTGLNGTGDKSNSVITNQSIKNMLTKMGMQLGTQTISVKDVAAVVVTATLPPFARPGDQIDATVSALGDSTSLQGGTLLMTPLKAADQQVYAVAQGEVSIGGFAAGGATSSVQNSHPTAGRVINGAIVERGLNLRFADRNTIVLKLRNPDFTTAARVAGVINEKTHSSMASALDASSVSVPVPESQHGHVVDFVASIEDLDVATDYPAKVVMNEKTGTVVMGEMVRISTAAVSHGNLTIEINTDQRVSQPAPLSQGNTVVVPQSSVSASEQKAHLMVLDGGTSIGDVVRALNAVGTTPRDLIAILQALKAAGALQADLEVI